MARLHHHLMLSSNWERSGLDDSKVKTQRPGTYRNRENVYLAYIEPALGDSAMNRLDNAAISEWLSDMAEAGLSTSTQWTALSDLRLAIEYAVPAASWPPQFPWRMLGVVEPRNPLRRRPNPEAWGGVFGDAAPNLEFDRLDRFAQAMRPCFRIVAYLEGFTGARRGEIMGFQILHFYWDEGGWLHLKVRQQRDLRDELVMPWTKSHSALRDLILPKPMWPYLASYLERYHGVDLYHLPDPDSPLAQRFLVVTSTGRDTDGSFMRASSPAVMNDWKAARARSGLDYAEIGYDLRPHQCRADLLSYLQDMPAIIEVIAAEKLGAEPEDQATPERREWQAERQEWADLERDSLALTPGAISRAAGHRTTKRAGGTDPGSATTPAKYHRRRRDVSTLEAHRIGRLLSAVIEYEIPKGSSTSPTKMTWHRWSFQAIRSGWTSTRPASVLV